VLNVNVYKNMSILNIVSSNCDVIDYGVIDGCEYVVVNGNMNDLLSDLDVDVVNSFEVADRFVVEGFSKKMNKNIVADNYKINIQLSASGDSIIIGYPIIKKSF